MHWHRGDPLITADDVSHPHQVVVYDMGEVVGRQPQRTVRTLQDDDVVAVSVGLDRAADQVGVADSAGLSGRAETYDVRLAVGQPLPHLLVGGVAPDRPATV